MIGRTDEQQNPLIPMAVKSRSVVWMLLAEPIWASGQDAASTGRTHDRIRTNIRFRFDHLNPMGRPHMVLSRPDAEGGANSGSRSGAADTTAGTARETGASIMPAGMNSTFSGAPIAAAAGWSLRAQETEGRTDLRH
jgi:hypothetical protein